MIPCGNAYFQPQACCQHNDNCLESSVCYNSDHGVTYIAGCTDKDYNASVCPDKFDDAGELGQIIHEENGFLLAREMKPKKTDHDAFSRGALAGNGLLRR